MGLARRLRLLGACACLFVGSEALTASAAGPSEVVFPTQRLPIRFSHKQHLGFKLACDFCHDRAESSTSAQDNLVPNEDSCRVCHKIDRAQPEKEAVPEARCAACHISADPSRPERVSVPPPNLKFNHKVHSVRQIPCARCHGDLATVDLATRDQLPRMSLCLGCHNQNAQEKRAPSRCATCHVTQHDGTLVTNFPSGTLVPSGTLKGDAHTVQFATEHARVAQDERYCLNCHRRDFCLSCHNGVTKPLSFHGNDYISIHPIDARKARTNCNACHRQQTFCLGCHERSGVTDPLTLNAPDSVSLSRRGGRFHPPYERWVAPPRTPEHHSWQAERNVKACTSCHREDLCLQCHSDRRDGTQPFNVSPHPPGFLGSPACRSLAAKNARVCLKCHSPSDADITCR